MKWDHENFENASVQMLRRRRRLIERAALAVEPQQRVTDRSLLGAMDDGIVAVTHELSVARALMSASP